MQHFWKDTRVIWAAYIAAAVLISFQKITQGFFDGSLFYDWGGRTAYENYRIFKSAFFYLTEGQNPYSGYSNGPWDLFKYSPAFALMMGPFALLPDWLGLLFWNLLNALVLLAAILKMPVLTSGQRAFMAWFVFIELITSMQSSQSNGLTAGLMLWAFIAFERGKNWQAAGYVAVSAFIKIFGIFSAILALLYPKWLKFSFWLTAWAVFFTLIPLLVITPSHLWQVYEWWWELLREDHEASIGLSVQGWLQTWFGWMPSKMGVTLAGLAVFLLSIFAVPARRRWSKDAPTNLSPTEASADKPSITHRPPSAVHRLLACASVLIWVVIFNHKAESPTFVIAMCGTALWWCASEQKWWEKALIWVAFALVSLSPTDIFPADVRRGIIQPYVLKAVPCIIIWGIITWRMFHTPKIS
ncbi:MAG: DUF2029 domain-containing protein [Haliscomenobacteraceae bacterium CHB4]|nr:DUF2029 domain-containing protein [Haliscomenobacteraceae bacterium CHB4]